MDTQTQIERLIELAIVQRTELKELVAQLPQLREHLSTEIEKAFDEAEPQLRAELEEWTTKQTADKTAALGVTLEAKIADLAKSLEVSTQARYNAIIAEREENARLAAQAEAKIAEHAASLPSAVKDIVSAELARFPRAGEIDQLRKEFAEPRGLNPRGKWQAGETYNRLDLVTINGDSYTSNTDGNRTRPSRSSANWTLVAARGTGGGGGPTSLSELTTVPSDGDLLIGSGTSWVTSNLTAGAGISITVGAGAITISATDGDITLDDGTAASPSLHFTNDPDTGIYRPAANTLGISVSGTQVAYFDENGLTVPSAGIVAGGSFHGANGNANNPSLSFSSDTDTGFFRHQPNEIGIAIGGTQYATLTSTTFSITPNLSTSGNLTVSGATSTITLGSTNTASIAVDASGGLTVTPKDTKNADFVLGPNGGRLQAKPQTNYAHPTLGTASGAFSVLSGDSLYGGYMGISNSGALWIQSMRNDGVATAYDLDLNPSGGNVKAYGNLTVSGTGTNTLGGDLSLLKKAGAATTVSLDRIDNTNGGGFNLSTNGTADFYFGLRPTNDSDFHIYSYGTTDDVLKFSRSTGTATFPSTGNVLVGTVIDSSNGKLQLATHSNYTGGIGFGTDISLYRKSPYVFGMSGVSDLFLESTGAGLWLGSGAGTYQVGIIRNGSDLKFWTGSNTLALTLDSSQNATFAGATVNVSKAGNNPALKATDGSIITKLQSLTAGDTAGWVGTESNHTFRIVTNNTIAASFDTSQNATFTGTRIKVNNVADTSVVITKSSVADWYLTSGGTSPSTSSLNVLNDVVSLFKISGNDAATAVVSVPGTLEATGTTGALTVAGGAYIAKALNIAGSIAIGNTVQTAAAVASTHKVTISIGGSTYYLLATNV